MLINITTGSFIFNTIALHFKFVLTAEKCRRHENVTLILTLCLFPISLWWCGLDEVLLSSPAPLGFKVCLRSPTGHSL